MDAREQLEAFLRQRLAAGETEIVLDRMSAAEALEAIAAARPGVAAGPAGADWRETLRAAGAEGDAAPARAREQVRRERPREEEKAAEAEVAGPSPQSVRSRRSAAGDESGRPMPSAVGRGASLVRPGLTVGSEEHELFAGPLGGVASLDEIASLVAACTRCPLYQTAKNPVPGTGNPRAALMVVGEAPGATEDDQGKPFVGAAGQLLTKILSAIQLSREDVFITNVLKHRPPLNRNPLPLEVQACSPYLLRQLELIRPKAILALGTFAAQTLLQTNQTIGNLRGLIHRYHGIPLVVTYHPAALLRNPGWKRPTWEDVQLVSRILASSAAS